MEEHVTAGIADAAVCTPLNAKEPEGCHEKLYKHACACALAPTAVLVRPVHRRKNNTSKLFE